jgi:hypothetical protein
MSQDYSAMTTRIVQIVQSAGTMDYSVAEVDSQLKDCLKEFSHYQGHLVPVTLPIESRYGTCSTTVVGELTDTVKGQFLATDSTNEKVVHNVHDRTWAVVASCASTSAVGLTKDIFVKNENYRIYNQRCWNEKQLYIGGMPDYVEIDSVEYPIGQKRNFTILNDVLELDVDDVSDSNAGSTISQLPDVDVLIRFNRPHVLTPLTDLVGKLGATCAASVTTISGSSLQAAGTLNIGDEFYIQGFRNLYTVTTAATIATTASISFYPPLEAAIASTVTTFTFTKSSLSAQQEEMFADLVAARLAINKPMKLYSQANSALVTIATAATSVSNMSAQLLAVTTSIASGTTQLAAATVLIGVANSVLVQVNAIVDLASTALSAGTVLINTITVDDTPQTDWINSAQGQLAVASGLLSEANGFFTQAQTDESLAGAYNQEAAAKMSVAAQYLNQASGYFKQVSSQLSVSNAGRLLENWGQSKLAETLNRLRHDTKPKKSERFPTEY